MDNITNRVILIAVGLFVSIAIISTLVIVIGQVQDIYKVNSQNSFLFTEGFNEFDMYNNTVIKGIDVLNCIKRYELDERIIINISTGNSEININCGKKNEVLPQLNNYRKILDNSYNGESGYNILYNAIYDDTGNIKRNKVIITFKKK